MKHLKIFHHSVFSSFQFPVSSFALKILMLLTLLFSGVVQADAAPPFPFQEQTPSLSFSIDNLSPVQEELVIQATVPLNHHAYLDSGKEGFFIPIRFDFSAIESAGYRVSPIKRPEGEFDSDVGATVLRGTGEFIFSFSKSGGKNAFPIPPVTAKFQICDDITKVCFPPRTVDLLLTEEVTAEYVEKESIEETVTALYKKHSQNFLIAFLLVFLAGLLSAATPCVYPMLPITSAIIMARGGQNRKKGRRHSWVYFLGIICTYFILGYIAGMTGGALNIIMRSSIVNLLLALFFFLFGISMLGFFELPTLENLSSRFSSITEKKGGFSGTLLMGMAAGLIVSPCVGPVVFTLLLQVADRVAEAGATATELGVSLSFAKQSLIAARGAGLMAGFGIGIGVPFLLVGFFGNKMPKSGAWMEYIKYILGLVILYIAGIYYLKGMGTIGIRDHSAYLVLTGIASLSLSWYLSPFRPKKSVVKTGIALLLLVAGTALIIGGLTSEDRGRKTEDRGQRMEIHGNLHWHRDFDEARKEAVQTGKPIFIDFYADWCANCGEFAKLSLKSKKLNRSLQKAVLVKIYDVDPIFNTFRDNPDHRELTIGLPYFCILRPDGELFWKGTRYDAVDTMSAMIEAALGREQ